MITNQVYLFTIFCIDGIIIGLLFDFFRILRRSFKTRDFITYIQDILFWILTGFILLYSILIFNNGEIRLFMFLGVFLGIILYILTISSYIIKFSVHIIKVIKNICFKAVNIISIPFKYIYKIVRKLFLKPISFFFINIRKFSTNLLKNRKDFSKKCRNI